MQKILYFIKKLFKRSGREVIIIRKSKWLLFYIILKFVLLFILLISFFIIFVMLNYNGAFSNMSFFYDIFGICLLLLNIYIWVNLIVWIIRYYFDFFVVINFKMYKFKIGIILKENLDIVEIFRVQEINYRRDSRYHILLGTGDIVLVQPKETEKIIHWIDNPKKWLDILQKVKDQSIIERERSGGDT